MHLKFPTFEFSTSQTTLALVLSFGKSIKFVLLSENSYVKHSSMHLRFQYLNFPPPEQIPPLPRLESQLNLYFFRKTRALDISRCTSASIWIFHLPNNSPSRLECQLILYFFRKIRALNIPRCTWSFHLNFPPPEQLLPLPRLESQLKFVLIKKNSCVERPSMHLSFQHLNFPPP